MNQPPKMYDHPDSIAEAARPAQFIPEPWPIDELRRLERWISGHLQKIDRLSTSPTSAALAEAVLQARMAIQSLEERRQNEKPLSDEAMRLALADIESLNKQIGTLALSAEAWGGDLDAYSVGYAAGFVAARCESVRDLASALQTQAGRLEAGRQKQISAASKGQDQLRQIRRLIDGLPSKARNDSELAARLRRELSAHLHRGDGQEEFPELYRGGAPLSPRTLRRKIAELKKLAGT